MMKNLFFTLGLLFFSSVAIAQPGDVPPDAEPGKCYAKCLIADEYDTVTEQVEIKASSTRTEVVDATFETVTEQVPGKRSFYPGCAGSR